MDIGDRKVVQLRVDGANTAFFEFPIVKLEEGKGLATSWIDALTEHEGVPLVEGEKQILGAYLININNRVRMYNLSDSKQFHQAIAENHIMYVLYIQIVSVDKIT